MKTNKDVSTIKAGDKLYSVDNVFSPREPQLKELEVVRVTPKYVYIKNDEYSIFGSDTRCAKDRLIFDLTPQEAIEKSRRSLKERAVQARKMSDAIEGYLATYDKWVESNPERSNDG